MTLFYELPSSALLSLNELLFIQAPISESLPERKNTMTSILASRKQPEGLLPLRDWSEARMVIDYDLRF